MCFVSKKKYNQLHQDYEDKCMLIFKIIKEVKLINDKSPSVFGKYPHVTKLKDILLEYLNTDDLNNVHLTE